MSEQLCPCGSEKVYSDCCGVFHAGKNAPTAEALMRSRYAAYALGKVDYLNRTHATQTRSAVLEAGGESIHWLRLDICQVWQGGPLDTVGEVEFIAYHADSHGVGALHERSNFIKQNGQWLYQGGVFSPPGPYASTIQIAPLDPCPCGSGKKLKSCCGRKQKA